MFVWLFAAAPVLGAPPAFLIALDELPEWAPGEPLTIRRIVLADDGAGQVVTTREDRDGGSKVLQAATLQRLDDRTRARAQDWMRDLIQGHEAFKSFYGYNENADPGVLVEGHPQAVVISFFRDGRLSKTVTLSGDVAYARESGGQYRIPEALIAVRERLFAYAAEAKFETPAAHYLRISPYGAGEGYWLLRSVRFEDLPVLTERAAARDRAFLDEAIARMPAFFPLDAARSMRIRQDIGLSGDRGPFRIAQGDERIVRVEFTPGAGGAPPRPPPRSTK